MWMKCSDRTMNPSKWGENGMVVGVHVAAEFVDTQGDDHRWSCHSDRQ